MDMPRGAPPEPSIGDLFGRLAEDGKAYVRAEIGLYRTIAMRRVGNARNGAIALVAAALLLNAALGMLIICFALGLAPILGPVLAGLLVFAAVAVIALFLAKWGASRLSALGGDAEERAALGTMEARS
jgi:fatty acid desaturase